MNTGPENKRNYVGRVPVIHASVYSLLSKYLERLMKEYLMLFPPPPQKGRMESVRKRVKVGIFSGHGKGNQHEDSKDLNLLRTGGNIDYLASKGWTNGP